MTKEFNLVKTKSQCLQGLEVVRIDPETKRCVFCDDCRCGLDVNTNKAVCPIPRAA